MEEKRDRDFYFKALNGFRGLAAIFILLFHSMLPWFRTLWIGVPMFFVLSGFLITRILIEHKHSDNYFKAFYTKRALRIFPIYYLALLISVLWGLLVNADLSRLPFFLLYLQNFTISMNLQPEYCYGLMNHTWSLSAEELFYLAWPVAVLLSNKKFFPVLIVMLGTASILYKIIITAFFYTAHSDQLLLLSLAGNLDGLMAGAFLGVLSLKEKSFLFPHFPVKQFLFALLLFLVVLTAHYFHFAQAHWFSVVKQSLSVLAVLVSFYLVAWLSFAGRESSTLHKFFHVSFFQFSGKISYGLYLYHALVFGITSACVYHFRIQVNPVLLSCFEVLVTYFIALVSWQFVEKPILKLKSGIRYSD